MSTIEEKKQKKASVAKQQRNPTKYFRNHPDQNNRRRRHGHHHGKTTPPNSDTAGLSNGPTPPPFAQLSIQEPIHASPPVNLTTHPICFYASSPIQPSYPFGHPSPHAPPVAAGQQPSKLLNMYSSANLFSSANLSVDPLQRVVFEVSTSLVQTDLPMYSKNPVISLPNVPSNYITNSIAFSAQPLTHDNEKPILVYEHCKKQRHTKDPETANTSQPIGPTASQTSSPTLSVIAQSGMSQSFGLISVDGTNPWILDSGATDHFTSFSEHFVTYTSCAGNEKIQIADGSLAPIAGKGQIVLFDGFSLQNVLHVPKLSYNLLSISKITRELHCKATFLPESVCFQDLNSGRTIGTARHSRGLYILNDDTFGSSISTTSLLSSYFSTSKHDFMLWHFRQNNILFLSPHNHINPHNYLPLSIVTFGVPPRSPPHLGKAAHLINRMPSCILHLQTPLECLKESYPSARLVSERGYKCFHLPSRKYFVTMDVTFCEDRPYFPVSHLQRRVRNLKKEVRSLTNQPPAPVQDFEPSRDQGMENPTEPCTNNTMSENDRSDAAVLENMEEKNHGDETEVKIETSNDEVEQSHTRKHDDYDPSLYLPIALRKEEMKALEKNNTWEIYALPKGHKPVGCKWVFTIKYKADGTLDKHKARVLLSIAANKDWPLYQLDVKCFSEWRSSKGGLHKPSAWFRSPVWSIGKIAVLIIYVDDIILSGDDQAEISQLKHRMGNEFKIKDLGNLKYFLGIEVARSKEGISVSQRKYTFDLLTETVPVDKEQYQRLVGKLIYLSHTRPDIFFVVSAVSQFMQAPYEEHMEAVKRILRYLKTTPSKGLMFRKTDKKTIEAYIDSDWAGSVVGRRSTSGYYTFVWGNLVTWRSKKQNVVSRSSPEAEYRAMSLGICEENLAPESPA
ncbi:Cysteine-rich RLK (RECEPTOR-like protein kinase) 8 [Cucumis melo var. makuwa]|uniref:Cysteine-rich RLK (RECEPTOR-like protein kinase) 8 n=1 Tax=Cucumis melo var. makuwa TaxID=1194695 RepID=A0A5A7TKR9_CUCMM|nr:Cysteine-rich RLK (RECEPTOR-like protein kinase) 8 [Cucumis melo var. makuwa]